VENFLSDIFIDEEKIQAKVQELGCQLTEDLENKEPVFICILKGSILFFADLIREVKIPLEVDFLKASSYGAGTESPGIVEMAFDLKIDLTDRHVVLVEDIVDSGHTLKYIQNFIRKLKVASLTTCTLLDKPDRRTVDVSVDYSCFVIPDAFVVGYGLDFDQKFRNLPYIGILKESYYSE
jgi:hypoxanthine phosphoribosyltransferase